MYVDRLYQPVMTLGPGTRIGLWTYGCSKHCEGCANPELWDIPRGALNLDPREVVGLLDTLRRRTGIDRLTVTGGDPLEQADDLFEVLQGVRPVFKDILVYTGYTFDQLSGVLSPAQSEQLTSLVDVLIDGPYRNECNDGMCALRGSCNQRVMIFNDSLVGDYEQALKQDRMVQNVICQGRSLSIGIHGKRS